MKRVILYGIVLLLCGCDLIEYHPYDVRLHGETGINAKNIARIEEICEGKDTLRFVLMGDSQRWYDETEDFVKALNKRDDVDFVIHGGDISDFGLTKEFLWVRDIMGKLKVPYVALLGNHDILGNGMDVFLKVYGKENFSFKAGNTKFVCMNTNALEFDYSHPVPYFTFMYNELQDTVGCPRTVPVMHVQPFNVEFNNNVARGFHALLLEFPGVEFCLHAHSHTLLHEELFEDGIPYIGCAAMKDKNYLLFTLTPGGYEYEVVYY